MDSQSAASAYREQSFESAPPIKIVRLLYQGCLRYLDQAARCDPAEPASRFVHWVTRADAVVTELRLALDQEQAPEVVQGLEQLYLFCEAQLQEALSERTIEPLANARGVLTTLLEAWSEIEVDASVGS